MLLSLLSLVIKQLLTPSPHSVCLIRPEVCGYGLGPRSTADRERCHHFVGRQPCGHIEMDPGTALQHFPQQLEKLYFELKLQTVRWSASPEALRSQTHFKGCCRQEVTEETRCGRASRPKAKLEEINENSSVPWMFSSHAASRDVSAVKLNKHFLDEGTVRSVRPSTSIPGHQIPIQTLEAPLAITSLLISVSSCHTRSRLF